MPKTMMIVRDPEKPIYRMLLAQKLKTALKTLGWRTRFCDSDPERVGGRLNAQKPDVLFSISFYPRLSQLAAQHQVPYACWEYDKIMNPELFNPAYYSPFTYFFATYLGDVRRLQAMDAKAAYLPAAPPLPEPATLVPNEEEQTRFDCDISFVGSSVISVTNSFLELKKFLLGADEQTAEPAKRALWDLVLGAVKKQEDATRESRYALPELIKEAISTSLFGANLDPEVLHTFLGKECCRFQRLYFLNALKQWGVRVYGASDWEQANLDHVTYGGHLSYEDEAPKAFQSSRINLNIARIYSMDGMSDRVSNVLSVGGFLLSNQIEGLERSFEPGKEVVVFRTSEELQEASAYYLQHDQERRDIAARGKARVEKDHTVLKRLETILAFMEQFPPSAAALKDELPA